MKRPYRLSARETLTAAPPFTVELVRKMVEDARRDVPKGRPKPDKWASLSEGEREKTIEVWTATLNVRHHDYYRAQEERGRKGRRDHAAELIDELRALMPEVVKDAATECDKLKGEFFSSNTLRAAQSVSEWARASVDFLRGSDTVYALPHVDLPDNVDGWKWAGSILLADFDPLIGASAAARFITAALPLLTGERPPLASVAQQLKTAKAAKVAHKNLLVKLRD